MSLIPEAQPETLTPADQMNKYTSATNMMRARHLGFSGFREFRELRVSYCFWWFKVLAWPRFLGFRDQVLEF